ncbi:hypothetical protein E4K10_35635 [Streptomyces sp. T1317-0309]|nr:hypothetical protein E4K10_35635 [Streptomyces sp. T1317-0309]
MPADGDAFHHALAEGLHQADPDLLGDLAAAADRQRLVTGLRARLAAGLDDPGNADLLAFVSPDTRDTFSTAELAAAEVAFVPVGPEQREFDDTGHMPLHAELPEAQRGALAAAQVRRARRQRGRRRLGPRRRRPASGPGGPVLRGPGDGDPGRRRLP